MIMMVLKLFMKPTGVGNAHGPTRPMRWRKMMTKKLKMFVWRDVLTDYTSGIICVLAHDIDEAREVLRTNEDWGIITRDDGSKYVGPLVTETDHVEPEVYETPSVAYVFGGG
jgi:hypothetical protein